MLISFITDSIWMHVLKSPPKLITRIVFMTSVDVVECGTEANLMTYLFDAYDKRERPVQNTSDVVEVSLGIAIKRVLSLVSCTLIG